LRRLHAVTELHFLEVALGGLEQELDNRRTVARAFADQRL
jgi:hypothetical protein